METISLGILNEYVKPFYPVIAAILGLYILFSIIKATKKKRPNRKNTKSNRQPISHWEKNSPTTYQYQKRPYLMTSNELPFYKELLPIANAKRLNVFSKVRIADLIEPKLPRTDPKWEDAFYKICFKHVDFVLCERDKNKPLMVIEVDDKTHFKNHRDSRDILVDQAMDSAGLPLLHTLSSVGLSDKIDDLIAVKNNLQ